MKKLIIISIFILVTTLSFAQKNEHLIGVRGAYNISGVDFTPKGEQSSLSTVKNISLVYTYYHSLWDIMPHFGFQAELSYQEQGYKVNDKEHLMTVVKLPLVSQFHVDFWKMRLLVNVGGFVGYRLKKVVRDVPTGVEVEESFDRYDNRGDFGFIAGGGLAYKLKPFEIHLECNYHYSLSNLYHPKKFSDNDQIFTYPNQLLMSVALYFHL